MLRNTRGKGPSYTEIGLRLMRNEIQRSGSFRTDGNILGIQQVRVRVFS